MFQLVEESLDQVALSIESRIDGALYLSCFHGWDMRPSSGGGDQIDDCAGVVTPVCDEVAIRLQWPDQCRHGRFVVGLTWREHDAHRQTVAIDNDIDLGAQSSTRTTDGVIRAPFFPPAACWCARTIEESIKCIDCGDCAVRASKT